MGTFKLIEPFLYKYKLYLLLYSICICLTYPLEAIIIPKIFSGFFENLKGNVILDDIFNSFFMKISIFFIISSIGQIFVSNLDVYLIPEFNEIVSNNFFEKILKYYENNYTDLELGKMLTRINGVPSILREVTTDLFNWVLPKLLTIVFINIYFYMNDRILGIGSFVVLFLIFYYNMKAFKKCICVSNKRYNTFELKSEELQDKLSNLYSIYSCGTINGELDNFKKLTSNFKDIHNESMLCSHNIKNKNSLLTTIIFVTMCYYIIYIYKSSKITKDKLITLFMTLIFYIPCLNTIITYLPDYTNHLGIIASLDDYIDDICKETEDKPDIILSNGNINIVNLNFGYTKNKNIFTNFNLDINSLDRVAIIGPSGNGKSTLIKLIMGYYHVPINTIFIDGQDINKYNLNSLRKQITFINQNTKLFNKSIYDNIKYGNDISKEDIDNLYNLFNLDRIYKNLVNGFDTIVGVNGDSISGGQKQIILLLRNYFKQNKIIILDEPTAALDNDTRKTVIEIINIISKNSTLIIITHDENNLSMVNYKINLVNGTII
jgi:ABC-type bacteriocin/lantibiotic exporter with double-glycine peptidase domain